MSNSSEWILTMGEHEATIHANGGTIAIIPDYSVYWKSNAHLIKAAPQLYKACEALLARFITEPYAPGSQYNDDEAVKMAEDALSEMKGGRHE